MQSLGLHLLPLLLLLCRLLRVNSLVKMVVDNLAEVNEAALLDLNLAFSVKLQS